MSLSISKFCVNRVRPVIGLSDLNRSLSMLLSPCVALSG